MVIPHYMGSREVDVESKRAEENQNDISIQNSFSSFSPLQDNIPLLLPQESDGLLDSHLEQTLNVNHLHENHNLTDKPIGMGGDSIFSNKNQEVEALVPDIDLQNEMFLDMEAESQSAESQSEMTNSDEWWENPEETNQRAAAADDCGEVGPRTTCRCQVSSASMNPFKILLSLILVVCY